jgi:hypothetical protein
MGNAKVERSFRSLGEPQTGGCETNPPMTTKRRGELAEAAFLYKAASLGFGVAKSWGESDRYDFLIEVKGRCWRVQVKSAYTSSRNGYNFHAHGNVSKNRYTRRDIDFIVGYVVPDDAWYVIPVEAYGDKSAITVFPSSKRRSSRFEKYRDAWRYLYMPDAGVECVEPGTRE